MAKKQLPSKTDKPEEDNKFDEFLSSPDLYVAENSNIEFQIKALKKRISKELEDDLLKLQYELNAKELRLKQKEIELQRREADLNAREARLSRLESFEQQKSPKELMLEQLQEEESEFDLEDFEGPSEENRPKTKQELRDYKANPPNIEGVGGLPGSKLSSAITLDRGKYQGDSISLENGNKLNWNSQQKQYEFVFEPSPDPKINSNRGLKFTYFAVEAAYLNDGYDNPNYSNFYSQTLLRKQVWYERTPRNRNSDGLGEEYQGRVPFDVLMKLLNETVNTRLFTSDGHYIENQDFRRAYKNWRLKYEQGTYYKTKAGDLYAILEPSSQIIESKGNPPTYRTDSKLNSPTYGQRVATSTEEKSRWRSKK